MRRGVLGSVFLLATSGQVRGHESPEQVTGGRHSAFLQSHEFTRISPDTICPFTVEVYPEVLHFGDPLYARLNFKNDTDTFAHAPFTRFVERNYRIYLKSGEKEISWSCRVDDFIINNRRIVWQKIEPGDRATQYLNLLFPWTYRRGFMVNPFIASTEAQWREILNIEKGNVTGQIGIAIANQGQVIVGRAEFYSILAYSSPIIIKPRTQKEMELLKGVGILANSFPLAADPRAHGGMPWLIEPYIEDFKDNHRKQNIKRIIPELTPGTLQNLLKFELLFIELQEYVESQPSMDKMVETRVLEFFARIENFLKPLHEIERENLKCLFHAWCELHNIKENLQANEILRKRFIEVFGEQFIPLLPRSGMGRGGS